MNITEYTIDNAIRRVAERTVDNMQELRQTRLQRRTEFTDLYGVPFTAQGDANDPAEFYISVSPDLVYFLRFQFKLHIQPFTSTVSAGTRAATVDVKPTNLTGRVSGDDVTITPNPHDHGVEPHSHEVVSGLTLTHTTASDFRVKIHGVDITPYLMEQQSGEWIDGEGLYPDTGTDEDSFYDVLDVATLLYNEGEKDKADKLLKAEFKKVEITSDSPFMATMYLYLKYSNVGR